MTVAGAVWCVVCGEPPTVTVTLERHGTLAHYGSCWDHVAQVAARARADARRIDSAAGASSSYPRPHPTAIDTTTSEEPDAWFDPGD